MRRLFWKFFAIIWLSTTASIAVLFTVTTMLEIRPWSNEVAHGQQILVLDLAAQLLTEDGANSAMAVAAAAASAAIPIDLSISTLDASSDCPAATTEFERIVARGESCYRLTLHVPEPSLLAETVWRVIPWLAGLASAAIAAYWLARYLIRPVARLRDGLSALARGQFGVRIGDEMANRKDEVAALGHDFDASAARLEALQNAQQQLFHDVSHELRSPLSRLQAAMGVMQKNPAKIDIMVERMGREVERIDGLIDEILTLAKLTDRSEGHIELQTVDIIDLIHEIVVDAAFEAQSRKIDVSYQGIETFVAEINGDLIYRALENVIRNSVKYTFDGTTVAIHTRLQDGMLGIRIVDQGPGVAVSDLERIFLPFSRGMRRADRNGYGLGLAITKQAVEQQGGRVWAAIPWEGGLEINVTLPGSSAKQS